jgi:methylmalonyl-CoA mutase C-terminal domain/subunit
MEAGMEVVYTGLRQSPEAIAKAALEEDVDVVGLSILSGAHIPLSRKVRHALYAAGADRVALVVGGNIPGGDRSALEEAGVDAVFPTGTPFDQIVDAVRRLRDRRER